MRDAGEIQRDLGIEDPLVDTFVRVQKLLIEVMLDVRDLMREQIHLHNQSIKGKIREKPLCTEICADPDLIRVIDGHGGDMERETKIERAKAWERLRTCELRKRYRCQWYN